MLTINCVRYQEVSFKVRRISYFIERCRSKNDTFRLLSIPSDVASKDDKFRLLSISVVHDKFHSLTEMSLFFRLFSKVSKNSRLCVKF